MTKTLREVTVKGYNKKQKFRIERTEVGGHVFMRLYRNNTLVLNATAEEFHKLRGLFV